MVLLLGGRMVLETPRVRVDGCDGVATLWLGFPGSPANGLDLPRIAEVETAVDAVRNRRDLELLVIRSAIPGGFCGGWTDLAREGMSLATTEFALAGQRMTSKLAELPAVTVSFVEGPCLGPGLELALACDYRIAVAGPDSWVGFPGKIPPVWGGTARIRAVAGKRAMPILDGATLTAKEAVRAGIFDDAFSARRGKIELQLCLDRLRANPRKRALHNLGEALAAERIAFRRAIAALPEPLPVEPLAVPANPVPPFPGAVALLGSDPALATLGCEVLLHGRSVILPDSGNATLAASLERELRTAGSRGRATPLELDQARKRLEISGNRLASTRLAIADAAGVALLLAAEPTLPPGCVVGVPARFLDLAQKRTLRPQRILGFDFPDASTWQLAASGRTNPDVLTFAQNWAGTVGATVRATYSRTGRRRSRAA